MSTQQKALFALMFLLIASSVVNAHSIHYQVENKGISARIFYSPDDPARYLDYEIFGPGDKIPHKIGRTDKNGFVSFLPDRAGKWIVKVSDDSDHGYHGREIEIMVSENLCMESFKKPFVASHIKLFIGVSFLFGIFGIVALLRVVKVKQKSVV